MYAIKICSVNPCLQKPLVYAAGYSVSEQEHGIKGNVTSREKDGNIGRGDVQVMNGRC